MTAGSQGIMLLHNDPFIFRVRYWDLLTFRFRDLAQMPTADKPQYVGTIE
ncbi:hypothetical protein [Legionella israelensis]|nr:hypothetical protein [Legionella israelensis]